MPGRGDDLATLLENEAVTLFVARAKAAKQPVGLPEPGARRLHLQRAVAVPENWREEAMVGIWKEVLGLDEIGVDDNFFQLGGDSIRSIQVQALAQKRGLRWK